MLGNLLKIEPISQHTQATRVYVPITLINRGLAAVRLLAISWLLSSALGKATFGQYQVALETINWLVALVMFGAADVAERYVSAAEYAGQTRSFLVSQAKRLLYTGIGTALVLGAVAPFIGDPKIVILVGLNVAVLAFYQWTVGVLRGLRAYGAAAGMELLAAILLLLLSIAGAWTRQAAGLLLAYLVANLLTLARYGWLLKKYVSIPPLPPSTPPPADSDLASGEDSAPPLLTAEEQGRHASFGRWALARMLLMMTFGLLSIWSVRWLAGRALSGLVISETVFPHGPTALADRANSMAADYSFPFRIAQMLAFAGLTFWASSYGIAARHWSHGRRNRAMVELLKIGKRGGLALLLGATALIVTRDWWLLLLPGAYKSGLLELLPGLVGVFLWYALLSFLHTYGDLTERPWIGTLLWGIVVGVQGLMIFGAAGLGLGAAFSVFDTNGVTGAEILNPGRWVLLSSAVGLGISCLVVGPFLLWKPRRMSGTAVPMGLILLAGLSFQAPVWVVGSLAGVITCLVLGFLWASGLLKR